MDAKQELETILKENPKTFVEYVYQGACVETAMSVLSDYLTDKDKRIAELEAENQLLNKFKVKAMEILRGT